MPGFHAGRPPHNKGLRYPADPPKVEEIVAVMRTAGDGAHARRLRGLIVILWLAGVRIQEALNLASERAMTSAPKPISESRVSRAAARRLRQFVERGAGYRAGWVLDYAARPSTTGGGR